MPRSFKKRKLLESHTDTVTPRDEGPSPGSGRGSAEVEHLSFRRSSDLTMVSGAGAPGSSCSPHLALDGLSVSSRLRGWDSHSGSAFVQDAVIFRTASLSEAPQPHSRFFHNYSFNPSLGIGLSQRQDSVVKQGRLDQTWLHGES